MLEARTAREVLSCEQEASGMNQPAYNVTRLQEITARLEELSKLDILDFWEEVKKLEQEKVDLERDIAA
jgi:hypothetical protein